MTKTIKMAINKRGQKEFIQSRFDAFFAYRTNYIVPHTILSKKIRVKKTKGTFFSKNGMGIEVVFPVELDLEGIEAITGTRTVIKGKLFTGAVAKEFAKIAQDIDENYMYNFSNYFETLRDTKMYYIILNNCDYQVFPLAENPYYDDPLKWE